MASRQGQGQDLTDLPVKIKQATVDLDELLLNKQQEEE